MAGKDDWKQTAGKAQRKKDADAYMNPPKNVSKAEDKKRFKTLGVSNAAKGKKQAMPRKKGM